MLKTIPYYFYQVDAIEGWLDEQAQKGLFPLETRFGTAMSFRRDTPCAVRYRIDVKRNIGYTDEKARIAAYREMGWEYVCDLTPYLDIYRCDDPSAPELNTDEETLHQVLDRRLRSDIRRGCAGILFAVVWCAWNLYEALRIDGGLYSSLLSGYALSKAKADTAEDMTDKAAYQKISAEEAYEMMASQEVVVVDVRTREEYDGGHIENAVLVPNESIGSEMPEALPDKEATLLVYCRSGRRSKDAAQKLLELGYQSVYDFGGVIDWPYELVKEG